jgi:RNA polymerase sigma-70 factor (ECF subfamily)
VDRATFQHFYEETASALRAYLRLTCRDAALADDLLQESYLRLLRRRMPELNAPQLKSYLYKTAQSALADHYRARQRETRGQEELASLVGTESDGAGNVIEFGDRPDVQRVFETLKPKQQSLLWLAYVEGFKHDEIAEVIGVNAGSVKVLLSRARAELAAKLGDRGLAPITARGVKG